MRQKSTNSAHIKVFASERENKGWQKNREKKDHTNTKGSEGKSNDNNSKNYILYIDIVYWFVYSDAYGKIVSALLSKRASERDWLFCIFDVAWSCGVKLCTLFESRKFPKHTAFILCLCVCYELCTVCMRLILIFSLFQCKYHRRIGYGQHRLCILYI